MRDEIIKDLAVLKSVCDRKIKEVYENNLSDEKLKEAKELIKKAILGVDYINHP